MSGSEFGGGFLPPDGSCRTLTIETLLTGVNSKVVAGIAVGQVLKVELQKSAFEGPNVVVLHEGVVAGGLASPAIQMLRQCMQSEVAYEARVTAKREAMVRVRVSAIGR